MAVNPVGVKVTDTTSGTSREIKIEVSRDTIHLGGEGNGNVPIQWNIDANSAQGWHFGKGASPGTNGIVIAAPPGKFDSAGGSNGPSNNNMRYTCARNNGQADNTIYKYSISVTDGSTTVVVDPTIINQP